MKETKDKSLEFVLRYYQAGKLDTRQAIRKTVPAKSVPLWRKWVVAASFAAVLFGGAYAAYVTIAGDSTVRQEQSSYTHQEQPASPSPSRHFHFDDTPLPDVLRELGDYYGVTLTANNTSKRLTADFDADSSNLDETIRMIEQVLSVRITVARK